MHPLRSGDRGPAVADDNQKDPDPKISEFMEELALVGKLTAFGRKQSSPEPLLSAVLILRKLSLTGGIPF